VGSETPSLFRTLRCKGSSCSNPSSPSDPSNPPKVLVPLEPSQLCLGLQLSPRSGTCTDTGGGLGSYRGARRSERSGLAEQSTAKLGEVPLHVWPGVLEAALLVKRESCPFAPTSHPTSLNPVRFGEAKGPHHRLGQLHPTVCARPVQQGARVCGHTGQFFFAGVVISEYK
jgi:hypothetical protein